MAEIMVISMIVMAATMFVSTTIAIVVLVKTWPMYKWTVKWFEKMQPLLEEAMESIGDSLEEKK